MAISPISSGLLNLVSEAPAAGKVKSSEGSNFADILNNSFKDVIETDRADKASAVELLTGQTDNMSGLLIDAEKAEIALQLTLQIRNKVVDAYNEIMRMQV